VPGTKLTSIVIDNSTVFILNEGCAIITNLLFFGVVPASLKSDAT